MYAMYAKTRKEQNYFQGTITSVCARRAYIKSVEFTDLVRITEYTDIETDHGEIQQICCITNDATEIFGIGDKVRFQVEKLKNITATVVKTVSKGTVKYAEVKGKITAVEVEYGFVRLQGRQHGDVKFFDSCCAVPRRENIRYAHGTYLVCIRSVCIRIIRLRLINSIF